MKQAVTKCLSINLTIMSEMIHLLLDSGSMVSLIEKTILITILGYSTSGMVGGWSTQHVQPLKC